MLILAFENREKTMKKLQVWDLPIRLFHWSLAIMVVVCIYTIKKSEVTAHQYAGVFVLVLLLFRIIWGLIGSSTARFWDFIRGPVTIYRYVLHGINPTEGHNPVGAFMVIFMLLVLSIQVITGLFLEDNTYLHPNAPLYKYLTKEPIFAFFTNLLTTESVSTRQVFVWVHEKNLYVIYTMIALHLAAILLYFIAKGQNLIKTMIVGTRDEKELHSPMSEELKYNRPWLALLLFIVLAIAVPYFLYGYMQDVGLLDWVQSNFVWLKGVIFGS